MEKETTQTVTVTGYGSSGEGIARLDDGRVVFIRGAARGDVLEIKLTKLSTRSAQAETVRILEPSPHRIEPDCPVYPLCGGCDFRHVTYEEEQQAKLLRVNDAMERIGGLSARVDSIIRTGQIDGYRNKAVLHSDGKSLGFYLAKSHEIVEIKKCKLLKDDLNIAINNLNAQKPEQNITLRSGRNGLSPPLEEELDGLVFRISGFFQVNRDAALLLFNKAREYACMSKNETLVDLYCGAGSLTLFVGRDAGYALGIELNSASIEAAQANAQQNGFTHIEFINADAARWDSDILKPDCLIVDPPRKGLSKNAVAKILDLSPKKIVYISCDPATLARDLKSLCGYTLADLCVVDMFPRTANVECCCLLQKTTRCG